jgi:hypothetical protein
METILTIIIAILICVIMLLIWCLYDAHKEIEYQTNLAKTFEQGYDKLKNKE